MPHSGSAARKEPECGTQPGEALGNGMEAGPVQQAVAEQQAAAQQEAQHNAQLKQEAGGHTELMWYFGFGSMCNPVSLRRRGIHPTKSYPAYATGWKLQFHLTNGMANIDPEEGAVTHGVLHLITPAMMDALAQLESIYDVEHISVTPYDPSNSNAPLPPVTATAFHVPHDRLAKDGTHQLPGDRYIRIITAGLRHFGVDQTWVESIAATPCRPTCKPQHYQLLPPPEDPASLPVWSAQQLGTYRGKQPVVFAVGDKVVQVDTGGKALTDVPYGRIMLEHFSGSEVAYTAIMALYEPLLPECNCPDDVRDEHVAWAENEVMTGMAPQGFKVRQIATLAPGAAAEARRAKAAATAAHSGPPPAATAPVAAADNSSSSAAVHTSK